MSNAEIIARVLMLPGVSKSSTITVEVTDPKTKPELAKIQSHTVYIVGPRGKLGLTALMLDGTFCRPTFM